MNIVSFLKDGYGLQIYFDDVTEENIFTALDKILNDPSFTEMAQTISSRFKDRPMSPQESVVYWTGIFY